MRKLEWIVDYQEEINLDLAGIVNGNLAGRLNLTKANPTLGSMVSNIALFKSEPWQPAPSREKSAAGLRHFIFPETAEFRAEVCGRFSGECSFPRQGAALPEYLACIWDSA